MIKVIATQTGYYKDKRYREGEVFFLTDAEGVDKDGKEITVKAEEQFSENWMEKMEDTSAPSNKAAQDARSVDGAKSQQRKSKSDGEPVTPKGTRPVPGQEVI